MLRRVHDFVGHVTRIGSGLALDGMIALQAEPDLTSSGSLSRPFFQGDALEPSDRRIADPRRPGRRDRVGSIVAAEPDGFLVRARLDRDLCGLSERNRSGARRRAAFRWGAGCGVGSREVVGFLWIRRASCIRRLASRFNGRYTGATFRQHARGGP